MTRISLVYSKTKLDEYKYDYSIRLNMIESINIKLKFPIINIVAVLSL